MKKTDKLKKEFLMDSFKIEGNCIVGFFPNKTKVVIATFIDIKFTKLFLCGYRILRELNKLTDGGK